MQLTAPRFGATLIIFSLVCCLAAGFAGAAAAADSSNSGSLEFSAASYSVTQRAGSVSITVGRSGGSSGAVSVFYTTASGTADWSDYAPKNGVLTWANGDLAPKSFAVPLYSFDPFTGTKQFSVDIKDAKGGAVLGATTSATVTIQGTPPVGGDLSLGKSAYAVAQNAASVTLNVSRIGGSSGAVSVFYTTVAGTANSSNFVPKNGVLRWAAGDASAKTVSVAIKSGVPFSGSKEFSVIIKDVKGGAALGTITTAGVTITGTAAAPPKTGTLTLSEAAYAVAQNAGTLIVSVYRTGGSTGAVTVGYGTADNTAKAGTDYTATSGVLSWASGDSSAKSFSVAVSNATPFSGSKSFAVAIASAGGGATIGTPANAAVTISGSATSVAAGAMGTAAAARLLTQGTMGPTIDSINAAAGQSYDAWFSAQEAVAPSLTLPSVPNDQTNWYVYWLTNAVMGQDQLRQRVAFALSEIFVISNNGGPLIDQSRCMAAYYDMLVQGAFSNYRTLLEQITLSVQMGQYLSMFRNAAANPALGTHADENYAREVMQLFSVGLVQLNLDGSVQSDSSGNPIPTYAQTDVEELARVFTGWASNPTSHPYGSQSWQYDIDYYNPMIAYPSYHDTGAKTIIGNVAVPAGGTPAADLKIALDTLFNHPNVGPFIGKQLIQRLVNSNPSPAYVARVAAVFNNNGQGVRGDLAAVVKAILTDPEAIAFTGQGKLREPLLRTLHLWRAFKASDSTGKISEFLVVQNSMTTYEEAPLQSPSVFNFFSPQYQKAGPMTNAGLVVPEFQITNEASLVLAANQNLWEAYAFIDSQGNEHAGYQGYSELNNIGATSVLLHTSEWEPYAATPATLVHELNLVFMQGQMPAAMQTTLTDYIANVPANTPWYRVAEAAELVIDSPQYSVQH